MLCISINITQHQCCLALAVLSIRIAQLQNCLALPVLSLTYLSPFLFSFLRNSKPGIEIYSILTFRESVVGSVIQATGTVDLRMALGQEIPGNFYQLHFRIRLQGMETQKCEPCYCCQMDLKVEIVIYRLGFWLPLGPVFFDAWCFITFIS